VIRKRFGQHFLEPAWVDKVVRAIAPQPNETFIEIGPGRGALTRPLVARAKAVVAYEIDRDLAAELTATAPPNLIVVEGDFLERAANPEFRANPESQANPESRIPNPAAVRVAGNLPYNVASPILFKLVELYARGVPLVDATVMLQREVADRLLAPPGGREYGVLSVLIQHAAHVEMLLKLPAGAFRPPPRVNSALVRLQFHPPDPAVKDPAVFAAIVQAVFTRRRKTLANALLAYHGRVSVSPAEALARAGLDGTRRPEMLSIGEFARLADVYASVSL
jgi:16S rRNA (adenine1518-N6/adenine1519-N6)-dimethyltransferase